MPILWAISMTLPSPTLVAMRTNAQFTEYAVASHRFSVPPPASSLTAKPSNPGTEHGVDPSTVSAGGEPLSGAGGGGGPLDGGAGLGAAGGGGGFFWPGAWSLPRAH